MPDAIRSVVARAVVAAACVVRVAGAQGTSVARESTTFSPLRADAPPAAVAVPVTLALRDVTLAEAIEAIGREAGIGLVFDRSAAGLERRVSVRETRASAAAVIVHVLEGSGLRALVSPSGQVVVAPRARSSAAVGGAVGGAVRDSATGEPLAGARVELSGTRFGAVTRDDGRFSLGRVPAGRYTLVVARIGFRPVSRAAIVVPDDGDATPVEVTLARAPVPLSSVVVTPGHFGLLQPRVAGQQTMTRQQLEGAPQIGEDIFRAITRLPGIAGNDLTARFHLRGAPQDELYVSLDGMQLIEPFHLKGLDNAVSIIDVKAIGGVDLTSGGFSAEIGDRLTGVLAMRSLEPRADRTHVSAGLSITNARLNADGGFAHGRGGWLVSARRGYVDLAIRFTDANDMFKPRYGDVFAKAQYTLPWGGRVAAHGLYASDDTHFVDSTDARIDSRYRSGYAWLTWDDGIGSRLRVRTVLSTSALSWRRAGVDFADDRTVDANVFDRRALHELGARQDWTLDVTTWALLRFGGDVRAGSATYDFASWRRELHLDAAHTAMTSSFDTTVAGAAPEGSRYGAYVSARLRPTPTLLVETGVRDDRTSYAADDVVNPRFNVAWEPRAGTMVRAAWGRYSQSQPLYGLQVGDGVVAFAPDERATQRVLGVDQGLPNALRLRAEAYDRRVTSVRPRYVNALGAMNVFPETGFDRLLVAPSGARARGLELMLSRDGGDRVDWSASYALASAVDVIDGRDVPRAVDQRHTLRGDWSLHPRTNRWRLAVAALWHSGSPATPQLVQLDTVFRPSGDIQVWTRSVPGAMNSVRLPAYRRMDARWTRYFDTRRGRVSVFAEVFNVLGTRNQRSLYTNVNFVGTRATLRQGVSHQVPRIPAAGVAWEF